MPDDDLFRDDLFPEDESEFFDDLASEEPFFPGDEDEFPDIDESAQEQGGVSRVFKILGGLLVVAVIGVAALVLWLVLGRDQGPTDNESTSTAVIATNTAVQIAYQNTVTAQALMVQATENAVQTQIALATATENAFQTQQAVAATSAAQTATAEFIASQTAQAAATQTAIVRATQAEAERLLRIIRGQLVGEGELSFANATLRLYRDDGDGEFNPAAGAAAPTPAPVTGASTAVPLPAAQATTVPVNTITYGATVEGLLEGNTPDLWYFTGTSGDVVTISAVAANSMQTDMFLDLKGPSGSSLTTDDDSGGNFNASIIAYELPTTGNYVIEVSSVSGPGAYTLSLELGGPASAPGANPAPTAETGGVSYVPRAAGLDIGAIEVAAQGNTTPEPTNTPQPAAGDEAVGELIVPQDGSFDFGEMEEGIYWIEIDYDSLSPALQALYPPGQPIYFQVIVPTSGEPIIIRPPVPGATPTPTATATPAGPSATPGGESPTPAGELVTPTPSPEPGTPATPVALPTTGFFGDIGDSTGTLEGSSGLMILAIAAVGLVAVVFIARRLRTSG